MKRALTFLMFAALAYGQGSVTTPLGVYNTSAPTLTNGQFAPLQFDSSANLLINCKTGCGTSASVGATGSAVPASADYTGINVAGNLRGLTGVNPSGSIYAGQVDLASIAGTTADTNSGNKSGGTLRVVIATDQVNLTSALNVSAAQSGNWTARIVGNAGGIFDAVQNAAAPANDLAVGGTYNSSQITTLTNGNLSSLQVDGKGSLFSRGLDGCRAGIFTEYTQFLAASSTQITATDSCVYQVSITNTDTANRLVSFQDQSTNCNSSVCKWFNSYLLPPGGYVDRNFGGAKFTGGIKANCDAANVCTADIRVIQ